MQPSELESRISGPAALKLKSWSSLWADLLHVDMVLDAYAQVPDHPTNLFVRRALWEGAVAAYGRTATTGSRQLQINELLEALGPDARRCHDDVMRWRNKHVAHRQDRQRETVTASAVIDSHHGRVRGVRIRVSPATGPEEDGSNLLPRFRDHIRTLRDLTWEQRLRPFEAQVLAECGPQFQRLLETATAPSEPDGSFSIQIDLSS
jgi:hypothetical protein